MPSNPSNEAAALCGAFCCKQLVLGHKATLYFASSCKNLSPVHPAGIQKTYTMEGSPPTVQTDGINFGGIWPHTDLIDIDQITTNDVSAVLHTYGVEAARATLMREVRSVFGAYGIGVDPRHLGLIADFMTHQVGVG